MNTKMRQSTLVVAIILSVGIELLAVQKMQLETIKIDDIISDTQVVMNGTGDDHLALAWWIPDEYWRSVLGRDQTIGDAAREEIFDLFAGYSLIAIVQADISPFGSFSFYTKDQIEDNLSLAFTGGDKKKETLKPLRRIDPDLDIMLNAMKPILGAAMGNMGNNFHFFVLDDKNGGSGRKMNPYMEGNLSIELKKEDGSNLDANLLMPLNSLFVPRKCPNGMDAHISWKYCPWTGTKLEI